jgi:hypothetical protein
METVFKNYYYLKGTNDMKELKIFESLASKK